MTYDKPWTEASWLVLRSSCHVFCEISRHIWAVRYINGVIDKLDCMGCIVNSYFNDFSKSPPLVCRRKLRKLALFKVFQYSLRILLYSYLLDLLTSVIEVISLGGVSQRSKEEIFCFEEEKIFFMVILVLNMWYSSCKRLISSLKCLVSFFGIFCWA